MYYHYKDSYTTGEDGTYILDENNERNAWRERNDERDYSILTLNAIDGSVIPRRPWT
jgi:adenylate cyclase